MASDHGPGAASATEERAGLPLRRWIHGALKVFAGLLAAIAILIVLASLVGVRVPIDRLSGFLSPVVEGLGATAEYAEGSYVELSLTPAIRLEDFRLTGEHVALGVTHLSGAVELLPLLRQELVIRDARIETGRLEISPRPGVDGDRASPPPRESEPFELSPWLRSLVVETARVTDVTAVVRHEDSGAQWSFAVMDLRLEMPRPGDVTASIGGSFQDIPFDLEARSQRRSADEWALDQLTLDGDGFGMQLTGQADPGGGKAAGLFSLRVEDSDAVQAVFGSSFVPFSPFIASADWDYANGRGRLVLDDLTLGSSRFHGEADLDLSKPVPELIVDLETPEVDLDDWAARLTAASELPEAGGETAGESEASGRQSPPLAEMLDPWLQGVRVASELRVGNIRGALLPVTDFSLGIGIGIEDETLTLPVSVVMGDVPLRGGIGVQTDGDVVRVRAPLVGPPSDAGELLRLLFAVDELAGRHEGLRMVASGEGRTVAELVDSVRVSGSLDGARISYGTRPVTFSLDTMELESSMHAPTSVVAAGELLGQPFEITARSDSLAELADRQEMHFDTVVTGPDTRLTASAARTENELNLGLGIESSNPGVMRDWLGLYPGEPTTVALGVQLTRVTGSEKLVYRIDPLRVGGSSMRVDGALMRPEGRAALSARLRGDVLDVEDVVNLFAAAPAKEVSQTGPESSGLALDVPILPAEISIFDADLDVGLGQLAYGALGVTDFSVIGRTRDGEVESAAVSGVTAYGSLNGSASADLRTAEPNLGASLELAPFRFGRLLEDLDFVASSELTFERASVDLDLSGETLGELLRSARLDMRVAGGRIPLVPELGGWAIVDEASLRNEPGEPIALSVTGSVRDEPLAVDLGVASLVELLDTRRLDLQLDGWLGGLALEAEFLAQLPVGSGRTDLRIRAEAGGLDAWNDLLGLNLPPWGPIEMAGDLAQSQSALRLDDFRFTIGESNLHGRVDIDLTEKPRVDVRLRAPMIQLEDFRTKGWTATGVADAEDGEPRAGETGDEPDTQEPPLVSRETFERLDATLALEVEDVRSGTDKLGTGQLRAQLLKGVFEIPMLLVQTPAGDVAATGRLAWAGPNLMDSSLSLEVDHFDYGILARRIDPASNMKGDLSLNASLQSQYPLGQSFMSNANGMLRFGVWPEDFRAGVFDLWAIGLLSAVMPRFSDDAVSTMNCVIGKFRVTNGVLSEESFLADSSKIQVTGETDADFRLREVDAYLSPEAKRAQIFSFAAPVEISGDFDDFGIGFRPGDLALAILRFVTSPVVAPIRWLVEEPLPADGEAACRSAWGAPGPSADEPVP